MLLISGWREIYRARKEGRLATGGPYAFVRHPQYTGIFLAIFGEGVVHWPTVFSLTAFPIIVVAYMLLARKEERQMLEEFGERYREYQERVPMFFPRWHRHGCEPMDVDYSGRAHDRLLPADALHEAASRRRGSRIEKGA